MGHRILDRTFTMRSAALVHGNRFVHDDVNTAYIVNIGKCNFWRSRLAHRYFYRMYPVGNK